MTKYVLFVLFLARWEKSLVLGGTSNVFVEQPDTTNADGSVAWSSSTSRNEASDTEVWFLS